LEYVYQNSQYVSKEPSLGFVPDEPINAYAGGAYIKGTSPILIAPDTPPLGRYLIGLSALLTNNENIANLLAGISTIVLLYLLGLQIFQKKLTALIPPLLVSFEVIFKNQLFYTPLLDLLQLPFLLLCFIFFNRAVESNPKKKLVFFILANLALGAFISIKFFITGFTIIGAWLLVLILNRKDKQATQNYLYLVLSLPLSLLVLLGSYFRVFLENHNLRQLFGIQKWVFLYHKSQLIHPFSVWFLIMANRWYVWFGDEPIISDPQWRVTWPIVLILSLITVVLYLLRKIPRKKEVEVILAWIVVYIAFLSVGQITSRYLVIYIPALYLASTYLAEHLGLKILKR
jgi:hypothetical protein